MGTSLLRFALVLVLSAAVVDRAFTQPAKTPADKAIEEATQVLEKALAQTKDPGEQAKLQAAILAVRNAQSLRVQNDLISDFIDHTAKYKGKTLAFRLAYIDRPGLTPLHRRAGDVGVPFKGKDPKNEAELLLGLEIPKGFDLPKAKDGEEVIVYFICTAGDTSRGNKPFSITRP
ncbi:MAG: hypothetical protein JWO38_4909 [Gemmataceae bacterium]|nr:hypothetical protein [Gemmataceae bacterium]